MWRNTVSPHFKNRKRWVRIYKNILLKKDRLKLLKFVKKIVKDLGPDFPGLQTDPNLHTYKEILPLLKTIKKHLKGYTIQKCWSNFSEGNYIAWHSHPDCDISMVYYLKNKSDIGTVFKKQGSEVDVKKCPENSLLIFNSKLVHSVPYHLKEERYSITFDLIKI